MAALSTAALTLLDHAKRLDPSTNAVETRIAELLSLTNRILDDAIFQEGNLQTGHRCTVRTQLPSVAWRLLNAGVAPSKSTTAQIDFHTGMLEAYSEVDVALAELGGNPDALRLSEARAFLEAMNQEMASTLFYGNEGLASEEFTGLSPLYSSLSAGNAQNIIDAGGVDASDNTSIWLISWDPEAVFLTYPRGSRLGLVHTNKGIQTVFFATGLGASRMEAYVDHWVWKCGLVVKDWRYAVRIANIDVSGMDSVDLVDFMERAEETIPNPMGKRVWYMNRRVRRRLKMLRRTDVGAGGGLTYENYDGKGPVEYFGSAPIRVCDAILTTESRVT